MFKFFKYLLARFTSSQMDSTSKRNDAEVVEYHISADPIGYQHLATHKTAEKLLGIKIPIFTVLNGLKKDRMFTVEESAELVRKVVDKMTIVTPLETKEEISEHLKQADKIIRRREPSLDKNLSYINKMAEYYGVPAFPEKIYWIDIYNQLPTNHTSARLKSLIYVAENHSQKAVCDLCNEYALKIAPSIIVEAVRKKIQDHPEKRFFLSVTPDLQEFFEEIEKKKERQTSDAL